MSQELERFQGLLRELFQFDSADLDFGIYRILNARRGLFEDWLTRSLPEQVEAALSKGALHRQDEQAERLSVLASELRDEYGEDCIDGDGKLVDEIPDRSARAKEYRALWEASQQNGSETSADAVAADIYNRLYDFFRRYYEDGDFLSLRRYGASDHYAVPYNGEEVLLHWANKDQYYIKTGEHFTDYCFRAGDAADAWMVEFKLERAEADRDNTRSGDKRYFFFDVAAAAVDGDARRLTVPVQFRAPTDSEKASLGKKNVQDKLNAEAEQKLLAKKAIKAQPVLVQALAHNVSEDPEKPQTMLAHHLRRYTRKNTSDFFIHKDLGGFLRRELDYYLKSEVLRLDALLAGGEQPAQAWLQRLSVLRDIGSRIIDFLAQVENFQKKLFEKRKFITECQWCITLDHVESAGLTDELVKLLNGSEGGKAQKAEWKRLFAVDEIEAGDGQPGWNDKVTAAFLRSQPYLVLDTAFMPRDFTDRLLASFDDLDKQINCLMIRGDNFQGANLIHERYAGSVDVLVSDPPYNTGSDGFPYKDSYAHSSWMTMMNDRVRVGGLLVKPSGLIFYHIGDKNNMFRESQNLSRVLDEVIGPQNYVAQLVWKNKSGGGNDSEFFAQDHEYIFSYSPDRLKASVRQDPGARVTTSYNRLDKDGKYALERLDKQSIRYAKSGDFVITGPDGRKYRPKHKDPSKPNATWRWSEAKVRADYKELVFENGNVYTKNYEQSGAVPRSLLVDERFGRTRTGKTEIYSMFATEAFKNPKPTKVERFLLTISAGKDAIVLDLFGGSGTVGHAVIAQNRSDDGNRRSILMEQGGHFDSVLRPRIMKAVYADEWEAGVPVSRSGGSGLMKYVALESYEDALSNLVIGVGTRGQAALKLAGDEYRLGYGLDFDTADSATRLSVEQLAAPFEYTLTIHDGKQARTEHVDLPETFAYLIGLIVQRRRALERDGRRYLLYTGSERANGARTAVLWRDIRGWDEEQFAAERKRVAEKKLLEGCTAVFVNGDSAIEDAQSLDPVFKARMFAPVH